MKACCYAFFFAFLLSSCDFAQQKVEPGTTSNDASAHGNNDGAGGGVLGGGISSSDPRMKIASTATNFIGHSECSDDPPASVKCAQQASLILKAAGTGISGSNSVNTLFTQLMEKGWKSGPCVPGGVRHSAGPEATGRHIGVIGLDGKAVHNSGSIDTSGKCGVLHNGRYPAWDEPGRAKCLVPPSYQGSAS